MYLKDTLHESGDFSADAQTEAVRWNLKKEIVRKRCRKRIGFSEFLFLQMKFIGWRIWLCQGSLLLGIIICITTLLGRHVWLDQNYAPRLLCCLSILISMTALPFIHRSMQYKMHELEATTRFSSVRLLLAKLILLGIGDFFMLSAILMIMVLKTSLYTGSLVLYLLFPFLLASSGTIFLLGHLRSEHYLQVSLGFYVLLITLFGMSRRIYPGFIQSSGFAGWIAGCVVLAAFCIWQLRNLARNGLLLSINYLNCGKGCC